MTYRARTYREMLLAAGIIPKEARVVLSWNIYYEEIVHDENCGYKETDPDDDWWCSCPHKEKTIVREIPWEHRLVDSGLFVFNMWLIVNKPSKNPRTVRAGAIAWDSKAVYVLRSYDNFWWMERILIRPGDLKEDIVQRVAHYFRDDNHEND